MATITEVRAGLRDKLDTIQGLNVPRNENESFVAPAALVWTPALSYFRGGSMGSDGLMRPTDWKVWLMASMANPGGAPVALDEWASPTGEKSIPALFNPDAELDTLDGLVEYVLVQDFRPLNYEEAMGTGFWGGEFTIEIGASRS